MKRKRIQMIVMAVLLTYPVLLIGSLAMGESEDNMTILPDGSIWDPWGGYLRPTAFGHTIEPELTPGGTSGNQGQESIPSGPMDPISAEYSAQ